MPFIQFQLRRGTAAEWTAANPTLASGELGLETDTQKIKVGNGSTPWNGLTYIPFIGGINNSIQVNNNGQLGGSTNLTWDGSELYINGTANIVGNVSASYFIGNGSQLTGLPEQYGNANVANYLPTYSGNIGAGNITVANTVSATNLLVNLISSDDSTLVEIAEGINTGTVMVSGNVSAQELHVNRIRSDDSTLVEIAEGISTDAVIVSGDVTAQSMLATGNITASYFLGNGSQLTGIDASQIQNGTSNLKVLQNSDITVSVAGTTNVMVFGDTSAVLQGNLLPSANATYDLGSPTQVWRSLYVSGNTIYVGAENLTVNSATGVWDFTSNGATLSLGAESTFGNSITANFVVGTIATSSQPNITSLGNLSSLTVVGDGVIEGNLQVNGNVTYISSNVVTINDKFINMANNAANSTQANGGGIGVGPVGSEYATWTYSDANASWISNLEVEAPSIVVQGNVTAGNLVSDGSISATTTITATGNISGGNLITSGAITATGNITGGNIITDGAVIGNISVGNVDVTGNLTVDSLSSNTSVTAAGNVTGNYFLGNGAFLTGIDTTLISNGTSRVQVVAAGGNVIANIDGNTIQTWHALGTDIVGTLTATGNITGGNISATNANVSSITATANAAVGNLSTAGAITATGNISGGNLSTAGGLDVIGNATVGNLGTSGTLTVTGNVSGGNLTTTGAVDAVGNISGGNLTTPGAAIVTGNVSGGNISTTGTVSATGNVSGGNITTSGTVDAVGNVSGGNIVTTGDVTATANVTGGNLITAGLTSTNTLSATGNANVGNIGAAAGVFTGDITGSATLDITGNANVGNLSTAGAVQATGNITGGNITTTGTANLGNVKVTGTASITGNVTAGNVSAEIVTANVLVGTLSTAAQPNITSLGTLSSLTVVGPATHTGNIDVVGNVNVTGNINYANVTDLIVGDPLIYIGANNTGNLLDLGIVASYDDGVYQHGGFVRDAADGTWKIFGNVVAEPTTTVDWANAIYQPLQIGTLTATDANFSGNISATLITGTVTTNAQPNITSLGTLTGLTMGGNIIPDADITYDLGSANNRFRDLYLSNSSIFLGETTLSATGDDLAIQGNLTANHTSVMSLTASGNVTGNYLFGDGGLVSNINAFGNIAISNGNAVVATTPSDVVTITTARAANIDYLDIDLAVSAANNVITFQLQQTNNYPWLNDTSFGLVTAGVTDSDNLGEVSAQVIDEINLGNVALSGIMVPSKFVLPSFTVATLPGVFPAGQMAFVTDAPGGAVPAYSDGTRWRSVVTGSIIE